MDSDFQQQQYQHHFQDLQNQFHHQKQQVNNLTRFRSAPSSYFASFLDAADSVTNTGGAATGGGGGGGGGDFLDVRRDFSSARPLSPETENIFARFMSSMGDENNSLPNRASNTAPNPARQPELMVRVKQENDTILQQPQQQQQNTYNTSSQMIYHSPSKPPLANQHISASGLSSPKGRPIRGVANTSMGMDTKPNMEIGIGASSISSNSTLTRHSSSPAGFFDNLNIEGFGVIRGLGNYGSSNTSNDPMKFSSGQPSSTTCLMAQNSDTSGGKLMRMSSLEETKFSNISNNQNNDINYMTGSGFPAMSTWDDSILSDNFSNTDKGDDDRKTFSELNASENQTGEGSNRTPLLAHHLSLPTKTAAEIAALDKLFQDSVPCRIRAKRGFATHPRSIAERVRRTKISERMRKLQDLVPNMDKQTNTADMLDLAVDYIKDLQKRIKVLDDTQSRCTCSR